MSETIKVQYMIRTSKISSDCEDIIEIDNEKWESMTEDEQEEYMKEHAFDHIEWNYKVVS